MTTNTFTAMKIKRSGTLSIPTTLSNGELAFSFTSNSLYIGSPANTPILVTSNSEINAANMANSGLTNIAANGTVTTLNTSQINFNNTATMNISTTANGTGTDVAWSANLSAIAGGVNNFQVDILANGSLILGNSNVNFNNTATVNVLLTANGTGQGNIEMSVNSFAITNIRSLNVTTNISNTGNLLVTQNTFSGNLAVTQNSSFGNISVTQNGSFGNINVTGITANVKQNLISGNITATQNISTGNLSVTTNVTAANITMNSVSFIPTWTSATVNATGTSVSGQNNFTGTITGSDTAGFWVDPMNIVHLRGLLANSGAANIAAFAGSPAMNSNIANNFPVPSTNVHVIAPAYCNGNGILNTTSVMLSIYHNGAIQMTNVIFANGQPATQALSWNIANISLYGITYSRV